LAVHKLCSELEFRCARPSLTSIIFADV
jgi:hypothetical protein